MDTMREWTEWLIRWAAENPWSFLYTVLLVLSPLFLISAFLSWKLAKHLEGDQKKLRAKQKKIDNIRAANNSSGDYSSERSTRRPRPKKDN